MKIAFIKQKYVPFGGGEAYLAGLMAQSHAEGHEIHLITTAWDDESTTTPIHLHLVNMNKRSRSSRAHSFALAVDTCVSENNFDCTFSLERTHSQQVWRGGDCVYQQWLNRRALYEPWYKTLFNRLSPGQNTVLAMETLCVESTPHIIANSQLIKNDLIDTYPHLEADIHVIHNGFDPKRFNLQNRDSNRLRIRQQFNIPLQQPVIAFIASGWRRKGLSELLQALVNVPNALLLIAGRDKLAPWPALAKSLGVEARVKFIGGQKDIRSIYHAADLTVLPSWYDSFGFVGLESIACGTPYVASRWAGSHEIIQENINGAVISRPDAIQELSNAIKKSLSLCNTELIANSVSHYTIEENVRKTIHVITLAAEN